MTFLAQAQGFAFAFLLAAVALLAFAAGVRSAPQRPASHDLWGDADREEHSRLVEALCCIAGDLEGLVSRGAVGPVRRVYVTAVTALGIPSRAPAPPPSANGVSTK